MSPKIFLLFLLTLSLTACAAPTDETAPYAQTARLNHGGEACDMGEMVVLLRVNDGTPQLFTYNKTSGVMLPFHDDPSCLHKDATCPFWGITRGLERCGDTLFANRHTVVYTRPGNPSGRIYDVDTMAQIKRGTSRDALGPDVKTFEHWGENVVATTGDGTLVLFDKRGKQTVLREHVQATSSFIANDRFIYRDVVGVLQSIDLTGDHTPVRLVDARTNAIQTDGERLYYTTERENALWRCDFDGANPEQLTADPVNISTLCFDDDWIYYARETYQHEDAKANEILRMPRDLSRPSEVLTETETDVLQILAFDGLDKLIFFAADNRDGWDTRFFTADKATGGITATDLPG